MKKWKRLLFGLLAAVTAAAAVPAAGENTAWAAYKNMNDNEFISVEKITAAKTGKVANITFKFTNTSDYDLENVKVGFSSYDVDFLDDDETLESNFQFPFEITMGMFDEENMKELGTVKAGKSKNVTLSARVRRDIKEGYYCFPVRAFGDNFDMADEYVNIWVSVATSEDDDDDEETGDLDMVLGEGQNTPDGTYPNVMNFDVNMRNASTFTAYDVVVSLEMSEDDTKYPFEINDANYDRRFEKVDSGETVALNYSMAIREDTYSGYYPIKAIIKYRDNSTHTGEYLQIERTFYVRIHNKEEEDDLGEFNENDRTQARIIVDSFETIPAEIIAGDEFELVLRMKNASSGIPASNILFSLESEKADDSAVFTTETGASSYTVNSLGAGEVTELRVKMKSRAGVDQRSYSLTINETYDSPEYKNAANKVVIDIPVRQIPRLSVGTIDVMPESITVGGETNVMFPVNNTGKVTLYNVTASFAGDSIVPSDSYVGNIEPGQTGNVDAMVKGAAPTMDDGKIQITISYEDENGEVSTVDKEMSLFVTEDVPMDYGDMDVGNTTDVETDQGFFASHKTGIFLAAAVIAGGGAGIVLFRKHKKKKQQQAEEEAVDDEIS
ncbi:MAG TPA: hypothetical protein IAA04_08540 [Candidatus Lachnoclostridium pullistercoris]|uniref:CARDB domain-containing protein n=1 Tax=Candidatus Lachnoclostridium pullistercoris TaxID=2838632 RepID=A0A9D2PF58_9FIRM|nr:hypothetical protein [Candidatus Lachnoclostridium pullistercoris]